MPPSNNEPMDVDALAALVQPWAEANMPEAWAKTREQASRPAVYAKFIARLIRRWYESGARDIPLSVLQESDLRVKLRTKEGTEFDVCGRYAEGDITFDFRFLSIMQSKEGGRMEDVLATIKEFDAVIEYTKPRPLSAFRVPPKPPEPPKPEVKAPVKRETKNDPSIVLELLPPSFRTRDD